MNIPSPSEFSQLEIPDAALVVLKLLVSDLNHADRSFGKKGWKNGIQPLEERTFDMSKVFSSNVEYNTGDTKVESKLSQTWQYVHDKGYLYKTSEPRFSRITNEGIAFTEGNIIFQDVDQLKNLHLRIRRKVEPQFRLAKNSDAIALAFNEVESEAKGKAWPNVSPPHNKWIEQAFDNASGGPLVNSNYSSTEQKSVRNLFLGAFGRYRNQHVHQNPKINEAETIHILGLASLLMDELEAIP